MGIFFWLPVAPWACQIGMGDIRQRELEQFIVGEGEQTPIKQVEQHQSALFCDRFWCAGKKCLVFALPPGGNAPMVTHSSQKAIQASSVAQKGAVSSLAIELNVDHLTAPALSTTRLGKTAPAGIEGCMEPLPFPVSKNRGQLPSLIHFGRIAGLPRTIQTE